MLALLSLMEIPISLLCFALYNVFLLVHCMRFHFPLSVFALAHLPLPIRVGWVRSRHVLLRLRLLLLLLL